MHSLITSYLLQSKECVLPGIGTWKIIATPASTDHENNKLLPPFQTIVFSTADNGRSAGLVKYISNKKHIEQEEAEDLVNNFCKEWREKIGAGDKLHFETIGSVYKNTEGAITFQRENSAHFLQPIAVSGVYKKNIDAITLTPDPISVETEIPTTPLVEQSVVVERSYWGLWALILLAIGSVVLFYHFKDHAVSGTSVGNQNHLMVDSATATYR